MYLNNHVKRFLIAEEIGVPVRFVIIDDSGGVFPITNMIKFALEDEDQWGDLYESLSDKNISSVDFTMLYYENLVKNVHNKKSNKVDSLSRKLKNGAIGNIQKLVSEWLKKEHDYDSKGIIKDLHSNDPIEYYDGSIPIEDYLVLYYLSLEKKLYKKVNHFYALISTEFIDRTRYNSEQDLQESYEIWRKDIKNEMENDKKYIEKIKKIEDFFSRKGEKELTEIDYISFLLNYSLEYKDKEVNIYNAENIFKEMIADENVPFIAYHNSKVVKYKLYKNYKELGYKYGRINIPDKKIKEHTINFLLNVDEELISVTFYVDINSLSFKYEPIGRNIDKIEKLLLKAFGPNIVIDKSRTTESKITATFEVKDFEYERFIWSDYLLNNLIASEFLFIEENNTVIFNKKQTSLVFHYKEFLSDFDEYKRLTSKVYSTNTSDVSITTFKNVKDIKGNKSVLIICETKHSKETIRIFAKILSRLCFYYDTIKSDIGKNYYDKFPFLFDYFRENVIETEINNLEELKKKIPGMFIKKYATDSCQKKFQPIYVEEKNKHLFKHVIEYPIGSGHHFSCMNDELFPGLKVNTLSNKAQFPYVPCCFFKDQKLKDSSAYNAYLRNVETTEEQIFQFLPLPLSFQLEMNLEVFLMPKGKYNFMKCILFASGYNYTDKDCEKLKKSILKKLHFDICKQELYDEIDLHNKFKNSENTNNFFRIYEHIFNQNIFVVNRQTFVLPRYKFFHTTYLKYQKSIILYTEDGRTYHTVVDTISDQLGVKMLRSVFGYETSKRCFELLTKTNNFLELTRNGKIRKEKSSVYGVNYIRLFNNKLKSQYIDSYGKVRRFNLEYEPDQFCTIFVKPCRPENLPIEKQIFKIDMEKAIKLFGDIYTVDVNSKFTIKKLNFHTKRINELFSVEVVTKEKEENDFDDFYINLQDNEISKFGEYKARKNLHSLVVELILWVYNIYRKDDFFDKYTMFIDENKVYKFSNFDEAINKYKDIDSAMSFIERNSTNFIKDGKFVFYEKEYYKKMRKVVENYYFTTRVKNYLNNAKIKTKNIKSIKFENEKELNEWLVQNTLNSYDINQDYQNIRDFSFKIVNRKISKLQKINVPGDNYTLYVLNDCCSITPYFKTSENPERDILYLGDRFDFENKIEKPFYRIFYY